MPRLSRGTLVAAVAVVAVVIVVGVTLVLSSGTEPSPTTEATPQATASPSMTASPSPSPTGTPSPTPSPTPAARCPFDGAEVAGAGLEIPVLISIDNHPSARPGTGLNQSDIIFENPVQGGSTRFVALFACDADVETIGPVRSGRWIQRDLWQQLRILPVIYGAAPYTTAYFAERRMPYIDGNVEPWPFFSRSSARPAPYNVYLDMDRLQEHLAEHPDLAERARRAGEPRALFRFADDVEFNSTRVVRSIEMRTTTTWSFGWDYDDEAGLYRRIDAGRVTTDAATGDPLTRRTIVVQRVVSERPFADPRPEADPPIQRLVGSGTGTVYFDGLALDVEWRRASEDDVTRWTVAGTGEELVLPPGPIWWEILPTTAYLAES